MIIENLEVNCRLDYCGIDPQSELPLISIRLYVAKADGKVMGTSVPSDAYDNYEKAKESLGKRFSKWYHDKFKTPIDMNEYLNSLPELKRKFNAWLGIKPATLEKINTLEIEL